MTRKDYLNAVKVIGDMVKGDETLTRRDIDRISLAFSMFFSRDNEGFGKDRFYEAVDQATREAKKVATPKKRSTVRKAS